MRLRRTITWTVLIYSSVLVSLIVFYWKLNAKMSTQPILEKKMCKTASPTAGNITVFKVNARLDFYPFSMSDVIQRNSDVDVGGVWRPERCWSQHRVAVIIPYRDRKGHLTILLSYLLPILKKQMLDFRIYVVEQEGDDLFNKGRIMNAAFKEAMAHYDFKCVIFHDVDMVPENDGIPYSCAPEPRHLSTVFNERSYIFDPTILGGAMAIPKEDFVKINGYSNGFWGWGGEDDEIGRRMNRTHLNLTHVSADIGRYTMLRHRKSEHSKRRFRQLEIGDEHPQEDGLHNVPYNIISLHNDRLYTHLIVNIGEPSPCIRNNTC